MNSDQERSIARHNALAADRARASADMLSEQFEDELMRLRKDPGHYMTPGARLYFRRVALGYVILAIATVMGMWSLTNRQDDKIRSDINALGVASCQSSIKNLTKYNALVDAQIAAARAEREEAFNTNDLATAEAKTDLIVSLQATKLDVPTQESCNAPILP